MYHIYHVTQTLWQGKPLPYMYFICVFVEYLEFSFKIFFLNLLLLIQTLICVHVFCIAKFCEFILYSYYCFHHSLCTFATYQHSHWWCYTWYSNNITPDQRMRIVYATKTRNYYEIKRYSYLFRVNWIYTKIIEKRSTLEKHFKN